MMIVLIALLNVLQNVECLCFGRGFYHYALETTLKSTILLDRVAILVERCGTDTLYQTASQRWLHDISSIH